MGLLRKKPLQPGKPLARGGPLKRGKGLKSIGKVKARENLYTGGIRSEYRMNHPHCEVGLILQSNKVKGWKNCRRYAEGVHERKKRSQGGSLTDPANLMSACNVCNGWVEDNPKEARRLGLTVHAHENPHLVPILLNGKNYGNA